MSKGTKKSNLHTRRDYIKYGSIAVTGGFLTGCIGESTSNTYSNSTNTKNPTEDGSYSVTMAPMGEVEFDSVPENWMAYFSTYGDMAIALGQFEGLRGLIFTENWPLAFYKQIPNIDISFDGIPQLMGENGLDKEPFYELNCDVHLMDPNFISILADNWQEKDFEEIKTNIGPIIGNYIRRRNEDWHNYKYYSLYEAFEKIAQVFKEEKRYKALKQIHDNLILNVKSELPNESNRPTIGLLSINSDFEKGSFYAYPIHNGNGHKQYRDLGIKGAFDDHIEGSYAEWDYEQLLEVDPDILLFQYGFSHVSTEEFKSRIQKMQKNPFGEKLSAVKNNRLYRGGTSYQGPIINLFQTEAAAKQFYPEIFGKWPGFKNNNSYQIPENEQLFDRKKVSNIIKGNL